MRGQCRRAVDADGVRRLVRRGRFDPDCFDAPFDDTGGVRHGHRGRPAGLAFRITGPLHPRPAPPVPRPCLARRGQPLRPLVFTNTGTRPCSLHGYPGVTLLDSAGDRIGEPARRRGPDAGPLTVEPGGSVYAALHTVAEGVTNEPCRPPAAQVQAYPPGSTRALRAPADSFRVCGGVFEVSAVEPGEHP
ncbi:DUF4232 domain-containing protein [Streptomyces sp. bgisy153]|uniref:DUF4232 domain-containing protein n=1 Tax=Streptomyces sp. bgisy153 TaxID=3413793 RepID=UPI003D711F80